VATNTTLLGILNQGTLNPQATNGLQAVLGGKLLTNAQAAALRQELNDPNLSPQQRGAIAAALQNDGDQKRRLQAATLAGGNGNGGGQGMPDSGGSYGAPSYGDGALPAPVASPSPGTVAPATDTAPNTGLRITELAANGPAAQQGLQVGDVIVQAGGVRTSTFDDVRAALQQAGGSIEIVFRNVENGQLESMTLYPQATRIGVSVEEVTLD
jgi:hypothetical protein